jgi:REP element-mobilizing transposase RayT
MGEWFRKCRVEIWAWCLMPNHVPLIAVPQNESGLARAIGEGISGKKNSPLCPWMKPIHRS